MINYFVFDGVSSRDFGLVISGINTFSAATRDVSSVSVPGRNGDLLIDNGRYNNVSLTYDVGILRDFRDRFDCFRAFVSSRPGYRRLEDTYHPNEFRIASFSTEMTPEMLGRAFQAGRFSVGFNCKPQRFLKSGEIPIVLSSPGALYNSGFEALPLITVYGSGAGTVTVGGVTVTIKSLSEYVTLDCDVQDAYKGMTNANGTIYAPEFPTLPPGECPISWSGGVTRLEITPRWWTL